MAILTNDFLTNAVLTNGKTPFKYFIQYDDWRNRINLRLSLFLNSEKELK
jgi:hypothetical protein